MVANVVLGNQCVLPKVASFIGEPPPSFTEGGVKEREVLYSKPILGDGHLHNVPSNQIVSPQPLVEHPITSSLSARNCDQREERFQNGGSGMDDRNFVHGLCSTTRQENEWQKKNFMVDNCPAHPKVIEGLTNIELFFLPPNTTSKIQPCDADIIRNFKFHYRRRFFYNLLEGFETGTQNPEKINILDTMNFAIAAWSINVQLKTIANCFQHFKLRHVNTTAISEDVDQLSEDVQQLSLLIKELNYRDAMDVEKVINYPSENKAAAEFLNDEQIISSVMENEKEDEVEDDCTKLEPVS
ncbi:CENP-B homolog protein 2-like [Impatiens glandulifera]|uniref:CENP-B homolog protein 2-like n=1 Tax=Impatiens glandulifera TaxID=253017 RepID=UPI001FB0EC26|nr:CENP-B homolog protein 2-like [Impatiens glandulifera]